MFTQQMWQVLRRRWRIGLPGLVLTVAFAFLTVQVVPPAYSITATVLLIPPVVTDDPSVPVNPYLQLGGLTAPAEILSQAMTDPTVQKELEKDHARSEYTVTRDYTTSAPIVLITVQDPSLDEARRVRDMLLERLPPILQQLQLAINVQLPSMIKSSVIAQEGEITRVNRRLQRSLLVVVVGGLVLTLVLATIVDNLALRRARLQEGVAGTDPNQHFAPENSQGDGPAGPTHARKTT